MDQALPQPFTNHEPQLIASVSWPKPPSQKHLEAILQSGECTAPLMARARQVREEHFGHRVHLRGIVEISNRCTQNCLYCGIRCSVRGVERYSMSDAEILRRARMLPGLGYNTIVLQGGEDPLFTTDRLEALVSRIIEETGLVVTLSLGAMSFNDYLRLRKAGAERYLLRFETANPHLFTRFHPGSSLQLRLRSLESIRDAGYQVGTGFLMGLPGSDLSDLARDILFTTSLQPDMIGTGPYIPPEEGTLPNSLGRNPAIFHRAMALLRLLNPLAHVPATTAFDSVDGGGREALLGAGCNVFMANLTPDGRRAKYALYPRKNASDLSQWHYMAVPSTLATLGLTVATGPGHSLLNTRTAGGTNE